MSNIIAAVLAAVRPGASAVPVVEDDEQVVLEQDNPQPKAEDETMENALNAAGIPLADHEAAVAKARSEGETIGAKAATDRIKAIMTSEEAKGRETLATHFAYDTSMKADDAIAALKASPKAEAGDEKKPATYEEERLSAAAGLTTSGGKATADNVKAGWAKAFKTA